MRAYVQRPLAFAIASLAALLSGQALGQPAEEPEEITVRGQKSLSQYRLELERARNEIFEIFNEANKGDDTDIKCRDEQSTGSRVRQTVCRSAAEERAAADASRDFLNSMLHSAGRSLTAPAAGVQVEAGLPQVNAAIGAGAAQGDAVSGEADALAKFELEWDRLLREDRQLYRAVSKYAELEDEYKRAGGSAVPLEREPTVVLEETPVVQSSGPQCETTTLTEYSQRNNVARVTGTISIASCPAGTTGSFTLVARVRDDNGEIRPLEFNETWQRNDTQDHTFNTDYPIGDNVELMNVRVRGLKCTCADPASVPGAAAAPTEL